MNLIGERIQLKLLEEKDIELVRKWRNEYHENFFDASLVSKSQHRQWYEHYVETAGRDYFFIIQLKDGTDIGTISLYNISISDRTADLGRLLLIDNYRGNGYMQEAINKILDIAFNDMRLYKVRVATHLDNIQAIATYAACGFITTTRPVVMLEKVNEKINWKHPVIIKCYEETCEND